MDNSVNSSPTSYTSSQKDDTLNTSSAVQHAGNTSSNASNTPNTSVSTNAPGPALGPIGSKPSTPNPAANAASPWGSQQQQQLRKGLGGAAIGSERSVSTGTNASNSNANGSNAPSSDWFSPLKSAPGFERSRVGQYQQQQQQQSGENQGQHPAHPGMQNRSISTSGIASIGSGRRQVSEANSVRSSRPASPSLSVITTSPSVNTGPSAFNPHQVNTSLSQNLQNGPSFLAQDQINHNAISNTTQNGVASTPSELESAFDAMLRGSSVFQTFASRIGRLEAQVHQLASQDPSGQMNGHYDATPTRSPSVAGSTSSYLTAPLGGRPQSLLIPNHAPSPASISTSLHSPSIPMQHASTEPSTPMYGPPSLNAPADRDVIRQLTVQLSALGNNVAQLMAQQQQMPQTPLGGPSGYDSPITPHSAHGHPGMHGGNHHHGGMGRPGMQNIRGASFDIPRGPVVPRGGPAAQYGGDEREPRNKRGHLTLQAPIPVGMGSRRSSADVIENMHNAAEGIPGSAGGPGGSALGSQSLLGKWEALGVAGDMLRAIVKYGIGPPSKIQMKAIPCVLNTQDIVAQASSIQERIQCYVIPTLQVVYNNLQQASMNEGTEQPYHGVQALVLTATIDQAGQAQRMCLGLGQALGITSSLVVGHGDISQEAAAFAQNPPHVLVGTPQKLLDLLSQRTVPVDKLSLLVIDEMDQLIARNLSEYVNSLAKLLPPPMSSAANSRERSPAINGPGSGFKPFEQGAAGRSHERQTAIFSCTVPQEVLNFASALNLREPVRVLVRRENNNNSNNSNNNSNSNNNNNNANDRNNESSTVSAGPNIRGVKHWFLYLAVGNGAAPGRGPMGGRQETASSREWKLEALADLCVDADFTQAVVYCSSIDSVEAVAYKLSSRNLDALALHGDMGASARHAIVTKFRSGNVGQGRGMAAKRVLVVYDALCRTLSDIHQVAMVVNFDLPRAVEDYIHRVSCALSTGYGRAGSSVNIVSSSADIDMLRNIESYYRLKINELPPNLSNII